MKERGAEGRKEGTGREKGCRTLEDGLHDFFCPTFLLSKISDDARPLDMLVFLPPPSQTKRRERGDGRARGKRNGSTAAAELKGFRVGTRDSPALHSDRTRKKLARTKKSGTDLNKVPRDPKRKSGDRAECGESHPLFVGTRKARRIHKLSATAFCAKNERAAPPL